jgi:hypothetical protein
MINLIFNDLELDTFFLMIWGLIFFFKDFPWGCLIPQMKAFGFITN